VYTFNEIKKNYNNNHFYSKKLKYEIIFINFRFIGISNNKRV
jgi:hypothetical protein